ncbi:methyltransferase-like protein 27 isoform X2 [Crassostrea angulata]|uniref:methyltransferase-like protein 27 isoform X2 n=1 Tax=Magallana angulata TaxID=2784310 RepID=UPI0022B20618|nr:methyltransferase-like protein 27 isoform X2 [Crassostrea angulata]
MEYTRAFEKNAKVFSGGMDKVQIIDFYNMWDDYEKDLQHYYNGPAYAAEAIDRSFPSNKDKVLILDVAAGTGLVGEELLKRGFKELHALDPSESMLIKAKKKNVYKKFLCEFVNPEPSPTIENGGMIVVVMREEYLHIPEYSDSLEPLMKQLQNEGLWMCIEKSVVHKYFCDKHGVIFRYRVLHRHL